MVVDLKAHLAGDDHLRHAQEHVEGVGNAPVGRVLHRHHSRLTGSGRQGLDHGADALLGQVGHIAQLGQVDQLPGGLLAIGADGAEEGETGHERAAEQDR